MVAVFVVGCWLVELFLGRRPAGPGLVQTPAHPAHHRCGARQHGAEAEGVGGGRRGYHQGQQGANLHPDQAGAGGTVRQEGVRQGKADGPGDAAALSDMT